jgi:hypothetical protein
MTDAFDVEQSHGVRVDQLEPGDHVIMFGRAVRIVATELSDAGTGRVVLRTRSGAATSESPCPMGGRSSRSTARAS